MNNFFEAIFNEKYLNLDLFFFGISICLIVLILVAMFFVSSSDTYRQLLSSLKFLCFVLLISFVYLIIGYFFVDVFAGYIKTYLLSFYSLIF